MRIRIRVRTVVLAGLVILAPFLIRHFYLRLTALPSEILIATGPAGGQWQAVSQSLQQAIESKCDIEVRTIGDTTAGSLQHIKLLGRHEVDFALYLRGTRWMGSVEFPQGSPPMFVANLYPDATLFLIRKDLYESGRLRSPGDLDNGHEGGAPYRVAVGRPETGEHTIARVILDYYFGRGSRPFDERLWNYEQVEAGFRSKELDAALLTAGHPAPIFRRLMQDREAVCAIGEIPEVDAILKRNIGLSSMTIPQGLYRYQGRDLPETPLKTISSQTMLLTHEDVSTQMVEEVTRILLSEGFIQENQLFELSQEGAAYASRNPAFPIHQGAMQVYQPQMRPLVDPDFMEAMENLRSFAVSLLIGAFLGYRWYCSHRERRMDHRLDEYFAELLAIDRTAQRTIESEDNAAQLRETLERVIALRNDAVGEFSARDFDEDRAADSLLSLCETIAAGIRSNLLRWDLQQSIRALADGKDHDGQKHDGEKHDGEV